MPILDTDTVKDAPRWINISAFGIVSMKKGDVVEPHFHDCDEFWFVISGKAIIKTEGKTFTVQKGEVVCTKMGDEHEVAEILDEEFVVVWVETKLRRQKRPGHLHR